MSLGKRLRTRRGGGRLVLCVALVLPLCTPLPSRQGDASIPSPRLIHPRPYEKAGVLPP